MTLLRRRLPYLALLLALALMVAAGSRRGSKPVESAAAVVVPEPQTTTTTTAPTTTTTTTLPPRFPLTGRTATDSGALARSAVAVKIDNSAAARPQAGIAAADVVYEEFTEGITRFIVVYQSQDAGLVGPVRSVRPADPAVVTPLGGVLAFSGGSPGAVAIAAEAPLTLVTESDTAVMYRRPGRSAPHNLYTSTEALRSRVPADTAAPPPFAAFLHDGQPFGGPGATAVSTLHVVAAPYVTADYEWDAAGASWLRSTDGRPHDAEGGRIAPTTVVVQFAPYSIFIDDEAVMYPEVVGSGDVWIFASGVMVQGTWSKDSAGAVTTFTDSAGAPILLPPGQTWVHLIAPGSTVTTG